MQSDDIVFRYESKCKVTKCLIEDTDTNDLWNA
jgi:hypothetical protein